MRRAFAHAAHRPDCPPRCFHPVLLTFLLTPASDGRADRPWRQVPPGQPPAPTPAEGATASDGMSERERLRRPARARAVQRGRSRVPAVAGPSPETGPVADVQRCPISRRTRASQPSWRSIPQVGRNRSFFSRADLCLRLQWPLAGCRRSEASMRFRKCWRPSRRSWSSWLWWAW